MPTKKTSSAESGAFIGKKLPKFKLAATGNQQISSSDLNGAVLYFYPKDSTSGCTRQGEDFRDMYSKFKKLGVGVFGVSRDSIKSHEKFKEKFQFPFDLLSDESETLCKALDILKMKSMYGRQYLGVDRCTFFIGKDGKIKNEWRNVKVPGHVQEVYDYVKLQR